MNHLNYFQRRQLLATDREVFNIREFGATGGADDSAAVERAALAASARGGTVYIPAGTWFFDNVTVYDNVTYCGEGWRATTVRPVSGSSNSIFKYKGSGELQGGSFSNMYIYGNGTDQGHGIDLSSGTKWEFSPGNCGLKIENCNVGVYCTQNNRRPYFSECYFWNNDIGLYSSGNHVQLDSCDLRGNRIGLSGDIMYDMQIDNCSFVRNDYGIKPDDFAGGGSFSQTTVTGCMFFGNYQGGAVCNNRVKFSNCHLIATTQADTEADSFGIWFDGDECGWIGGIVDAETPSEGFGDYAFVIDGIQNIVIEGVTFEINKFVRTNPSQGLYRRLSICNNTGNITHGRFASLLSTSSGIQGSRICGNQIGVTGVQADYVDELTTNDGFIELSTCHANIGNMICDNVIQGVGAGILAYALDIEDSRSSIITGNLVRYTAGINVANTNAGTIYEKNIFDATITPTP